jgi:hypothetical protein
LRKPSWEGHRQFCTETAGNYAVLVETDGDFGVIGDASSGAAIIEAIAGCPAD